MRRRLGSHPIFVVVCAAFLLADLQPSPGAQVVSLSREQRVQLQEQATRKSIDRFNEAFNRHDADALTTLLTEDTVRANYETQGVPYRKMKGTQALL